MEPDSRHLISVMQLVGRMALHSLYFFPAHQLSVEPRSHSH